MPTGCACSLRSNPMRHAATTVSASRSTISGQVSVAGIVRKPRLRPETRQGAEGLPAFGQLPQSVVPLSVELKGQGANRRCQVGPCAVAQTLRQANGRYDTIDVTQGLLQLFARAHVRLASLGRIERLDIVDGVTQLLQRLPQAMSVGVGSIDMVTATVHFM